jgi:hypothetical protein
MKKCQTCGNQNADEMRFCLNCGTALPDAPVIVNFGNQQGGQSSPGTNPYGQSMETQFGKPQFQQPQPPPPNYSMVPPPSRAGGSKKMLIAVGGVAALLLLILAAGAAIVGYNIMKNKQQAVVSPTPSSSPSASPSASPSPSASKTASPTPKPSATPKVDNNPNVKTKFDKVWVDYNVTEGGERGMRIHVKFEVTGLEGVDSYLMIYFQKDDGTNLTTSSSVYGSMDGKVAAKQKLKPGYEVTVYKDLEVFMPYSELNLTKGKYNLKMDIDLADENETLVEHLGFYEFEYEKF